MNKQKEESIVCNVYVSVCITNSIHSEKYLHCECVSARGHCSHLCQMGAIRGGGGEVAQSVIPFCIVRERRRYDDSTIISPSVPYIHAPRLWQFNLLMCTSEHI